jgi:hypothetical protein
MLNNPQVKSQIKAMYKLYKGNPNEFIQQTINKSPALQNNPLLKMALNGGNPNKAFQEMLSQAGLTMEDFQEVLK